MSAGRLGEFFAFFLQNKCLKTMNRVEGDDEQVQSSKFTVVRGGTVWGVIDDDDVYSRLMSWSLSILFGNDRTDDDDDDGDDSYHNVDTPTMT